MYGTIWRFAGDPAERLRSYDAMIGAVPASAMIAHLCLRGSDGIVVVDTCPSREAHEAFVAGSFPELRRRFGLPDPEAVHQGPVHAAFLDGRRAG